MLRLKAERLVQWKRGSQPGPVRVTLFPTHRCNIRCSHCPKTWRDDPPGVFNEISDERWLRLVEEGAELGVREWLFAGGGEPMLRRDLVMAMARKIRALGMNGILQNNGTIVQDEDLDTLVRLGWQAVNVSIDGHTPEINDRIRSRQSFRKATHVVRQLAELKRRYGSDATEVCVAHVITALNYEHLCDFVTLIHEMGADYLYAADLIVFDEVQMAPLILSPEQREALPGIVARAKARCEELGLRSNLQSLHESLGVGFASQVPAREPSGGLDTLQDVLCYEPFTSLTIMSSGEVSPCCVFWDVEADNIRESSFKDVWCGPYMSSLREGMLKGSPHNACRTCYTPWLKPQRDTRTLMEQFDLYKERFDPGPVKLIAKSMDCLRKHGLRTSLRRGREWLEIRRKASSSAAASKEVD